MFEINAEFQSVANSEHLCKFTRIWRNYPKWLNWFELFECCDVENVGNVSIALF